MKKLFIGSLVLGLFFVPQISRAQDASWLAQMEAVLNGIASQISGMQVAAATRGVSTAAITAGSSGSGCASTMLPAGSMNHTVRCDGKNWVAANNMLNDGGNVSVGTSEVESSSKLYVGAGSNQSAIRAYSPSFAIHGESEAGTGIYGSSGSGRAIQGSGNGNYSTAVFAYQPFDSTGYGVYQEGENAKNYFQGKVSIGVNADSDSMLTIESGETEGGIMSYNTHGQTAILGASNSGSGVIGDTVTGVALEANVGGNGFGIVQTGNQAKNEIEGRLSVGRGLSLMTSIPKPTCNEAIRGTMWYTRSTQNHVADKFEVCGIFPDSSGSITYVWKSLVGVQ